MLSHFTFEGRNEHVCVLSPVLRRLRVWRSQLGALCGIAQLSRGWKCFGAPSHSSAWRVITRLPVLEVQGSQVSGHNSSWCAPSSRMPGSKVVTSGNRVRGLVLTLHFPGGFLCPRWKQTSGTRAVMLCWAPSSVLFSQTTLSLEQREVTDLVWPQFLSAQFPDNFPFLFVHSR